MQYISPISIQFIWHPIDEQLVSPIVDYCKKNLSKKADKPFLHSLDFPIFTYTSKSEIELPSEINTKLMPAAQQYSMLGYRKFAVLPTPDAPIIRV